jgi:hypothetical protein
MKPQDNRLARRAALLGVAAWVVAAVTAVAPARAEFVFNPTGGGASGALTLTGFDPLPGNALAQGAVTAIANAQASGGGDTAGNQFLLYYQAAVGSLLPSGVSPPGLNHSYQITITGVVREFVSSVVGGTAIFGLSADQTGSSLNFYQNNAVTYNDLNGTGFTDGTKILTATPVLTGTSAGNFTNTGVVQALDQHGNNDWPGTQTVVGFGGSVINFKATSGDPNYFVSPLPNLLSLTFSTTQNLPFTAVDPARALFTGGVVNVGAVNGLTGPDILLQADANVSAVPEPSSVCLTALGVGGLLLYGRKKRARA